VGSSDSSNTYRSLNSSSSLICRPPFNLGRLVRALRILSSEFSTLTLNSDFYRIAPSFRDSLYVGTRKPVNFSRSQRIIVISKITFDLNPGFTGYGYTRGDDTGAQLVAITSCVPGIIAPSPYHPPT
jgi:hypothetical protein